jgi:hypothetical protein
MICAFCAAPLDSTGSRTCSCRRAHDVTVVAHVRRARRERRERQLHHLTDMLAGVRAGLTPREAIHRADEVAEARARVLAEHERREAS